MELPQQVSITKPGSRETVLLQSRGMKLWSLPSLLEEQRENAPPEQAVGP